MSQTYSMKRGDTLSLGGTVSKLPAGIVAARAMVRNPLQGNRKLADLNVSLGDYVDDVTPRALLIEAAAADTATWPTGAMACDIEFQEPGGIVVSTETFTIKVQADVTYG